MKIETLAVHAGRHIDPSTGAVTTPIHLSTTFERSPTGEYPLGFSYSREGNPNRRALEECLAGLEGGKEALVFSSGLAVATALVQGLEPGDHIIAPDDVYWGLRKVIGDVFGKAGLETSYADMTDADGVRAAIRPTTRLIWVETPSNPLMKVTDLTAIGKLAREAGPNIITVCDGTFATPILQHPLDCGIDMVCHSTTKYISGHSDVVGGALITRHENYLFERARRAQHYGGAVPSPFDCWLSLRGIDTLPYRVRAHSENALRVARHLKMHGAVEAVHYPGLPDHPGYEIAARQMSAFGGMLSFQVAGGRETAMNVAARCRLFIRATSLGGAHSLIEHRASVEGPQTRTPQNLLRLSVGLEHADDLIADLDQALG
ncbi:MAG TPA: aminotransferase class I/II-fold pyridoxal phosphate-dependent enzyme [Bryobacteraceae bacterium]|jgi:cystathionine gamma-synthase|nr:aminotransferase class I/II-fold pyridoxal phosphate-dependent enzyme [Bryobacteraceae bacterium]